MKIVQLLTFVIAITALQSPVFAGESTICSENGNETRCINTETKVKGSLTFAPSFKSIYELNLLPLNKSCDSVSPIPGVALPKRSYFRQTQDHDAQTEKEMVVHVYEVSQKEDPNTTESTFFDDPFRVCLSGANEVPRSSYKRVGGVSTGLLVVPFKFRSGDIYSDSTIGQYVSYKWEVIELLATAGLSQISVSEVGSANVESKTGLTFAIGVNLEITKNWDIAIIVGQDHLSGNDGDNWEFQDEPWVSFAIGFNFTR